MAQSRQIAMRFPEDVKKWLKDQAELHRSSQNSEVIRAIRERMERTCDHLQTDERNSA